MVEGKGWLTGARVNGFRRTGGLAMYYQTRATPYNARRVAPFFSISSLFFFPSFCFFLAGRTDRRSMAVFRVVAPSPPSRRKRFLMTVILARKEGKGGNCVSSGSDWLSATGIGRGRQSDSRFQGGCAHQRPLKVAAQCARAPISALSRFFLLFPFFLFGIFIFLLFLSLSHSIQSLSLSVVLAAYNSDSLCIWLFISISNGNISIYNKNTDIYILYTNCIPIFVLYFWTHLTWHIWHYHLSYWFAEFIKYYSYY